jgi:FKBP-type peptidyl-prolyl cis-trans isomerase FkpA
MIRKNFGAIILLLSFVLMVSVLSCNPEKQFEEDEKANIQDYLNKNSNLNFIEQPSGLYYLEVVAGTGLSPVLNDSASVKYTGKFLDGSVFDSNIESGKLYVIKIGDHVIKVIPGFEEGITLMKEGGKCTLLIPSKLAFGKYGSSDGYIPGYTPLLFDIELVKVVKATK